MNNVEAESQQVLRVLYVIPGRDDGFSMSFANEEISLLAISGVQTRLPGKELVYMREVYGLYLFFKLFEPTLKNVLIYLWSRVGRLVFSLTRAVIKRPPGAVAELRHLVGAYYLCLRRSRDIKRGNLEFFNSTLGTDTAGST